MYILENKTQQGLEYLNQAKKYLNNNLTINDFLAELKNADFVRLEIQMSLKNWMNKTVCK